MSDWTDGLREGVEDLVAGRDPGPHLEPDEIAAYEDGTLAPAEAERTAGHLVLCRECAELLLDLRALRDPGAGEEEAAEDWSAADADALWQGVRAGLRREGDGVLVPFPQAPSPAVPAARPPRWLQAVAACLLAAVLVLAVQVARLGRQAERLSQPQLNAPVIDLFPEGTMHRGGQGAAGEGQVPGEARIYTLVLHLGSLGAPPDPRAGHHRRGRARRQRRPCLLLLSRGRPLRRAGGGPARHRRGGDPPRPPRRAPRAGRQPQRCPRSRARRRGGPRYRPLPAGGALAGPAGRRGRAALLPGRGAAPARRRRLAVRRHRSRAACPGARRRSRRAGPAGGRPLLPRLGPAVARRPPRRARLLPAGPRGLPGSRARARGRGHREPARPGAAAARRAGAGARPLPGGPRRRSAARRALDRGCRRPARPGAGDLRGRGAPAEHGARPHQPGGRARPRRPQPPGHGGAAAEPGGPARRGRHARRLAGIGDLEAEAFALLGLARARRHLGELDVARLAEEAALARVEALRGRPASPGLRARLLALNYEHYDFYVGLLMEFDRRNPGVDYAARALAASEEARARSLVEMLAETGADLRRGVDPRLVAREAELGRAVNAADRRRRDLVEQGAALPRVAAAEAELRRLLSDYDRAQAEVRRASPRLAALSRPRPLTLRAIQTQVLDRDTLLLEYALGRERSVLWAVTAEGLASFELPAREVIERAARRAAALLAASDRTLEHGEAELALAELRGSSSSRPRPCCRAGGYWSSPTAPSTMSPSPPCRSPAILAPVAPVGWLRRRHSSRRTRW